MMPPSTRLSLGLAALLASVAAAPAASTRTAPQPEAGSQLPSVRLPADLDRVLRDYEKAWQARDAAALSELFAEDGFVLSNGRPPMRGRSAIRATYSGAGGPLALRALAFSTGGDVGYIIGGFGREPGSADTGKFVLALKRSGGRWLIMADMDNSNRGWAPQPTPSPAPPPSSSPEPPN